MIVAAPDPRALGSLVTLDVPVDEHTYKWTVPFYNQNVAPEDRIGPDLLTHTPGDVESYPTRTDLAALTLGEMHWDLPGVHPVGQGRSSDFQSVSFEVEQATEEQRTVTRGYGGGVSFGIGVSADVTGAEGALRSTSYALETTFEASVGDIADPTTTTPGATTGVLRSTPWGGSRMRRTSLRATARASTASSICATGPSRRGRGTERARRHRGALRLRHRLPDETPVANPFVSFLQRAGLAHAPSATRPGDSKGGSAGRSKIAYGSRRQRERRDAGSRAKSRRYHAFATLTNCSRGSRSRPTTTPDVPGRPR